jgi:hypothetical protein
MEYFKFVRSLEENGLKIYDLIQFEAYLQETFNEGAYEKIR